jgi:hypothetical protein
MRRDGDTPRPSGRQSPYSILTTDALGQALRLVRHQVSQVLHGKAASRTNQRIVDVDNQKLAAYLSQRGLHDRGEFGIGQECLRFAVLQAERDRGRVDARSSR